MSWEWIQIVNKPPRAFFSLPSVPSLSFCPGEYPALITIEEDLNSRGPWREIVNSRPKPHSAIFNSLELEEESRVLLNRIILSNVDEAKPDNHLGQQEYLVTNIKPSCFLRVVSYMVSDVILIQGTTIKEAADRYSEWLESCRLSIELNSDHPGRQSKPFAVVMAGQGMKVVAAKAYILSKYCEAYGVEPQVYHDLERSLFAGLIVVAEREEPKQVLASVVSQSLRSRKMNRHLWSIQELTCLLQYAIDIFSGDGTKLYNSVHALSPWANLKDARDKLWPELLKNQQFCNSPKKFQIKLFSRCLSRYAVGCAHGMYQPLPHLVDVESIVVFHPDEMFFSVFHHVLKDLFPPRIREKCVVRIKKGISKMTDEHVQGLDHAYFQGFSEDSTCWVSIISPRICLACIIKPCKYSAPCGHTLCEDCFQSINREKMGFQVGDKSRDCPFCQKAFSQWEQVSPPLPANLREGAMHQYYGLAFILLEVGLNIRKWNLNDWIRSVADVAKFAWKRPDIWIDLVGGWSSTWRNLVHLAGRDCPLQRDAIQHNLQKAFGFNILPATHPRKNRGLDTVVWTLTAKLFFFELKGIASSGGNRIRCKGTVRCHPEFEELISVVNKFLRNQAKFCIQDNYFTYQSPCAVDFLLPNLEDTFDIQLVSGNKRASIEAFPTDAQQIIKAQAACHDTLNKIAPRPKRRYEKSDTLTHWPKRRKL